MIDDRAAVIATAKAAGVSERMARGYIATIGEPVPQPMGGTVGAYAQVAYQAICAYLELTGSEAGTVAWTE